MANTHPGIRTSREPAGVDFAGGPAAGPMASIGRTKGVPAIVGTDLTKWFGEGSTRTIAVDRVGITAFFGEVLFIVGPSGSGKTTMLSMLSGILRPNTGSVVVAGADIWKLSND